MLGFCTSNVLSPPTSALFITAEGRTAEGRTAKGRMLFAQGPVVSAMPGMPSWSVAPRLIIQMRVGLIAAEFRDDVCDFMIVVSEV